ncbi:M1 family metallopeptidase [soil metagenome]
MGQHRHFIAIVARCLLLAIAMGAWPPQDARSQGTTSLADWGPTWPLSSRFAEEFEGDVPANLPAYTIDVALDAPASTLRGEMEVVFTNHTGIPLSELPFRLYPNAEYYGEGGLSISGLAVDGEPAQPRLSVADTVITAPLGKLLALNQKITIQMAFETIVPVDSSGSFGIFSHDAGRDTWILADWYPIIAGWDPDNGWELDPPTRWGDPTFAEASIYDVRVSVPAAMSVVSTGATNGLAEGETIDSVEIATGPVREFAMVLDDGFQVSEAAADGTIVRLHVDEATNASGAGGVLQSAVDAVEAFAGRYGAYPYDELDIVQTELAAALGVSWSGVIFMDAAGMSAALAQPDAITDQFLFTLVHEIGHQWWGGLIGANSNDHAFMNESLTNYLTVVAFEDMYGEDASQSLLQRSVAGPYLAQLTESGDGVVNVPIQDATNILSYSRLVYGKGGLGFLAIRLEIGDEAFFMALRSYTEMYAFELAGPEDLLAVFEQAANQSLGELWQFWFDASQTTAEDVDELLAAAGSR